MTVYASGRAAQSVLDSHPPAPGLDGREPCRSCRAHGQPCPRPQALRTLAMLGLLPRRRPAATLAGFRHTTGRDRALSRPPG